MNKKYIAYSIQITLLLIIFAVGSVTYKSIQFDKTVSANTAYEYNPNAACPPPKKRECVMESYSSRVLECPVLFDECNSQVSGKYCYHYSWKGNIKTGNCKSCEGTTSISDSERIYVVCKPKK